MDGLEVVPTTMGTPQGAVISPLLANIYLHYCFDLWVSHWRKRAGGNVVVVRFADDIVMGFQYYADARALMTDLPDRLGTFALKLHPEKTRLIAFGKWAAERRRRCGVEGRPETFAFLGFRHICGTSRQGNFLLMRQTRSDRMRATLHAIREQLRKRMHDSVEKQGRWLQSVLRGYFAYHAVPTNVAAMAVFRYRVMRLWRHALSRRSQNAYTPWRTMDAITTTWLPQARILHPWPQERFAVSHPR
jgi:RNA-directed DNA polymerase